MLPVVVNIIGLTFVTVPPVPLAVKVPPLNNNPEPIETAPGAASDALTLPNILDAGMFCILA